MDTALIIAILSLLASLATFFVAYLSPAKIRCSFGPTIALFYEKRFYYDKKKRKKVKPLYLFIPTTILNSGSKAGSVFRIAVTLHNTKDPKQVFYMQWRAFCSLHRETGIWGEDELAHEISLKGNSTETKWVSFYWGLSPSLDLEKGSYKIDIYYWDKEDNIPHHEEHEIIIDETNFLDIQKNRLGKSQQMIEISLDEKSPPNKFASDKEIVRLVSDTSKRFTDKTNEFILFSILIGAFSSFAYLIPNTLIDSSPQINWWQNLRLIFVLVLAFPMGFISIGYGMIALSRIWASLRIIRRMKYYKLTASFLAFGAIFGMSLGLLSILLTANMVK